jgi:hypothetical protein
MYSNGMQSFSKRALCNFTNLIGLDVLVQLREIERHYYESNLSIHIAVHKTINYLYSCFINYTSVYRQVSGLSHNEINTHREVTLRIMAAKLTRLTHKIAIQLHLVAESYTIYSSRSRRPVQKIWVAPSCTIYRSSEV